MTDKSDALLQELLALYAKYGTDAFLSAVARLRKGVVSTLLVESLEQTAFAAEKIRRSTSQAAATTKRKATGKKRANSKELLQKYVEQLHTCGKQNAAVVVPFVREIAEGSILDSPALLRQYIEMLGSFPSGRRSDRNLTALQIGKHLMDIPLKEAEERISMGRSMRRSNSSLEAWTNVIVKED